MEFDKLIEKRTSVRSFKDKKVDWRLVLEAVYAATQAPYAGNHNNVRYVIIQDPRSIKKIAETSNQEWMENASIIIVACAEYTEMKRLYEEKAEIFARQQAGAAIENLLLKLTDLGLAACWVGAFNERQVSGIINLPNDERIRVIEAIIPVGYEKPTTKFKKKKKSVELSVYWEVWGKKRKPISFKDPSMHSDPAEWI